MPPDPQTAAPPAVANSSLPADNPSLLACFSARSGHPVNLRRFVSLVVLLWLALLLGLAARQALHPDKNTVFPVFTAAGQRWLDSQNVYDSAIKYRYSPAVAGLLAPFSRLPTWLGGLLWLLLNVGVFFGGFVWWARAALPPRPPRAAFIATILLAATPLLIGSFNNLQANPMVIGFMLAATAAVAGGRFSAAMGFLLLAALLKVYPLALALVFLVLYFRRFSWRLPVALAVGLLLPFLMQKPGYVIGSYQDWIHTMRADVRAEHDYRDLQALWTYWCAGTFHPRLMLALTGLSAAAIGATALVTRRRHRAALQPSPDLARAPHPSLAALLGLVVAWLMLFNPSTESSTYMLLGPPLAWALVESLLTRWPWPLRALVLTAYLLEVAGAMAVWFPAGRRFQDMGPQPLGALLLLIALAAWMALGYRASPAPALPSTRT